MIKRPRLMYFTPHDNMGDIMNVDLCKMLLGVAPKESNSKRCDCVFVGSMMHFLLTPVNEAKGIKKLRQKPIHIWGTGFIDWRENDYIFTRPLVIHALRGEKTKEKCELVLGEKLDGITLADPGLLACNLIDFDGEKKFDVGIVPHYVDKENEIFQSITIPNSKIIDIQSDVSECIKSIAECRVIISSSLHGLIVADSFGIPNIRMICSDRIHGGDFKYDDYYSAFGLTDHNRIDTRNEDINLIDIDSIVRNYKITEEQARQKRIELLNSFPFNNKGRVKD